MAVFELDIRFFHAFIKGIAIKGIGFEMIFRGDAGKVHKVVGTENSLHKSGPVVTIPVNKGKLPVTEVSII